MRLGDLDALKGKAVPLLFPTKMEPCGHIPVPVQAVVVAEIEQAPTIDAVPVVRCKDCKWFAECVGKDSGKPCGYGQCTRPLCMRSLIGTDDFCSYGERKDGEG